MLLFESNAEVTHGMHLSVKPLQQSFSSYEGAEKRVNFANNKSQITFKKYNVRKTFEQTALF